MEGGMPKFWMRVFAGLFLAALVGAVVLQFQDPTEDGPAYIAMVGGVGLPLLFLLRRMRPGKPDA